MTAILDTNARPLFTTDHDPAGYALPDEDPIAIRTRFTHALCAGEDVDELVYHVEWASGLYADMFTIPNRRHDIFVLSSVWRNAP